MPQRDVPPQRICAKGEATATTVFIILLLFGVVLEIRAGAKSATRKERINLLAGAFTISIILHVMFGVYAFLASKVKEPADRRRCCNVYLTVTMIAYWTLTVMCITFEYLRATVKMSGGARFVCDLFELASDVSWIMLFLYNIERAYRPKEENVVVGGGDAAAAASV